MNQWAPEETSTHQDHVIAHVIGATVLGYFVLDETLHLVLDIGFIWSVYLDGQMVLLPQTAALGELEVDAVERNKLERDIDWLEGIGRDSRELESILRTPGDCLITEVSFFADGDRRRLLLHGEAESLQIETSLRTGEISVSAAKVPSND